MQIAFHQFISLQAYNCDNMPHLCQLVNDYQDMTIGLSITYTSREVFNYIVYRYIYLYAKRYFQWFKETRGCQAGCLSIEAKFIALYKVCNITRHSQLLIAIIKKVNSLNLFRIASRTRGMYTVANCNLEVCIIRYIYTVLEVDQATNNLAFRLITAKDLL